MRTFFLFYLLLISTIGFCQQLVCNGGFEEENICTEYQKNCAPEGWMATSLWANYYFDQAQLEKGVPAYEGTHFVGLTAGSIRANGIRNFLRTRLVCGLRAGHQYRLIFYVRAYEKILDSIGIYFSPDDFLYEKRHYTRIEPQLWSVNGLEDSTKDPRIWQKVELIYTAAGNEGFITIGNFKRKDYRGITTAQYRTDYYFFIDAVSFKPVDSTEKLCIEADSVRQTIYSDDIRHDYLEKRVYYMRRNPPSIFPLPVTQMKVTKVQRIDTLIIPDIFFNTASYELSPKSFHLLDSFSNALQQYNIDSVVVEGHTDSIGKLAYNTELSSNRALSVKEYITQKVASITDKTVTRGFAYLRPVATNKTPQGRQRNRRVEIFVYRKE